MLSNKAASNNKCVEKRRQGCSEGGKSLSSSLRLVSLSPTARNKHKYFLNGEEGGQKGGEGGREGAHF